VSLRRAPAHRARDSARRARDLDVTKPRDREPLSPSLERNPELDQWIRIEPDGSVTLFTGKVELGQGIRAAIARIGAEELDVALERVRVQMADTAQGPNELMTVGSMSIEQSGRAMRQAAAEARQVLLERAAQQLGAPLSQLEVEDGTVRVSGSERSTSYAELAGGVPFQRQITGEAVPKAPEQYRIVGKSGPRPDLLPKLTGGAFLCDLAPEGLLHGRVVRPPSYAAELLSCDEAAVHALPGVVAVLRDGRFLGVVAEREEQAVRAREVLSAGTRWREEARLPREEELHQTLLELPRMSFPVIEGAARDEPLPAAATQSDSVHSANARYTRPYQMHGSLAPSSALARFDDGALSVWTHAQGPHVLRLALAPVLGMDPDRIRVIHADGSGCYGHNGADDAALDAALLARAVPGRPVLLQWMREDEHAWEPYAPAMVIDLQGGVDRGGQVVAWNHDVYSGTHMGRPLPYPGRSQLLASWHLSEALEPPEPQPALRFHAGIHRNADPYYAFASRRIAKHLVPERILRTSSTRGLGAYANVFAIESFMDELAHAAQLDPLEFRLAHLDDPRARAVLEAAAERAGWPRPNQGLAFARYENIKCYAAVIVELAVDEQTGHIALERTVIAADAGQVIDPDGLVNQLEGGFIQAASWTLLEAVHFDRTRVTSRDWESYPILTFPEIPALETVLLDRPDAPSLGAGEATQGPTPAAIANAVFRASGARLRNIPFTPERVQSELRSSC
jgi:CO/xanthine dehydrogenase Mo-binding subunit